MTTPYRPDPRRGAEPRRAAVVRTVAGDIEPDALSVVLGHEHLICAPPRDHLESDLVLDDRERMTRALTDLQATVSEGFGGRAGLVEMSTVDYGRDVAALADLSRRSGVHVVAVTGFNKGAFSQRIVDRYAEDALASWMTAEVEQGALPFADPDEIDLAARRTRIRAGVIKAASGHGGASASERKAIRAAVTAHRTTGAPIGTHTEKGTWVVEQAESLLHAGARPDGVLIGHTDFLPAAEDMLDVVRTGVSIGLDQFGKEKYLPDATRVERIAFLASEGYLDRIVVAGDLARRSYHPQLRDRGTDADHPGLTHIPTNIVSMLQAAGLTEDHVLQTLQRNPRRWLSFTPRDDDATRLDPPGGST